MGAIGSYVHYYATNYIANGTKQGVNYAAARRRPPKDAGILGYWQKTHNDVCANVRAAVLANRNINLQQAQDEYNEYRSAILHAEDGVAQETLEAIKALIAEKYQLHPEQLSVDEKNNYLSVDDLSGSGQRVRQLRKQKQEQIKGIVKQQQAELSRVSTLMQRIQAAIDTVDQWSNGSQKKKDEIIEKLEELRKTISSGVTELQKQVQSGSLNVTLPSGVASGVFVTREWARDFINKINKLLGPVLYKSTPQAIAAAEEMIAMSIDLQGKKLGESSVYEALRQACNEKGGTHGTWTKLPNFISINQNIANELAKDGNFQFRTSIKDASGKYTGEYTYGYKSTQSMQKADAYFTIDGKAVGLSVKAYNLKTGEPISLVKDTPLLNLIAGYDTNGIEYANHFLNVLAYHPDTNASWLNWKAIRNEAQATLAVHVLYSALSGRWTGKQEGFADILVVKDKSTADGVKFYDVATIVDEMQKNIYKMYDAISAGGSFFGLENSYQGSPANVGAGISHRLTRLLASAHSKKISVSIAASDLGASP